MSAGPVPDDLRKADPCHDAFLRCPRRIDDEEHPAAVRTRRPSARFCGLARAIRLRERHTAAAEQRARRPARDPGAGGFGRSHRARHPFSPIEELAREGRRGAMLAQGSGCRSIGHGSPPTSPPWRPPPSAQWGGPGRLGPLVSAPQPTVWSMRANRRSRPLPRPARPVRRRIAALHRRDPKARATGPSTIATYPSTPQWQFGGPKLWRIANSALAPLQSASVKGFGRRPVAIMRAGTGAVVGKPPGKEPAGR
jgi:hypothetical protein